MTRDEIPFSGINVICPDTFTTLVCVFAVIVYVD
jgi:hypothetical protein